MLFSNPRTLPALLLCIGVFLAGHRWYQLEQTPPYDAEEVELAVELNYALDLARAQRDGQPLPDAQQRLDDKARLREEIEAHFYGKRNELQTQIQQGIIAALIGLVLYVGVMVLQRRGVIR